MQRMRTAKLLGTQQGVSAATESMATSMVKNHLATHKKGPEDEQARIYSRRRSITRKISRRAAVEVERRGAEDLTDATGRAPALLATEKKSKNGSLGRYRQGVESQPQSPRGVYDSVHQDQSGLVMMKEFECLDGNETLMPAE